MSCIQHEALNDANIFHFTHTYAYSIFTCNQLDYTKVIYI